MRILSNNGGTITFKSLEIFNIDKIYVLINGCFHNEPVICPGLVIMNRLYVQG